MSGLDIRLDQRVGPFAGRLDSDLLRRYAVATNDPSVRAQTGDAAPPVAIVTQIWQAQEDGRRAIIPQELMASASGGVHGEHDIVLHRAIRVGEPLQTWVEGFAARPAGRNLLVTLRYSTMDESEELVAEQWWTTVLLNATCDPVGGPLPDHRFPDAAREHAVGAYTTTIDAEMPRRYAEVSSDWSEHHFTAEAARRSGFDRPFLHGLCTMALCSQGIVAAVAEGDPQRVRRLAVRFAAPAFVGEDVTVQIYQAGPDVYAFEAKSAGADVITNGLAELRA